MRVVVYADDLIKKQGYWGVELSLPVGKEEIEDALQRARVPEYGSYHLEYLDWPEFLAKRLSEYCTLEEINVLAYCISQMNSQQLEIYEGAVELLWEEMWEECWPLWMTEKSLINLSYNLNCYDFYPGVLCDADLGEICIEGGILELIDSLPDETLELLDVEKVGRYLREKDGGTYTPKGYVLRNTEEFQEVFDGRNLPEMPTELQGTISLQLVNCLHPEAASVWLALPAEQDEMRRALESLKAESFDDCVITESRGPALTFPLAGDEDIEKLNLLAERVKSFSDSRMREKYRAAMELELCSDLDLALDIAANLDCYDFDSELHSLASYAEYLLKKSGVDTEDSAFALFDFQGYGERKMKEVGYISTAYGLITRNKQPFQREYTKERQSISLYP
ncbi:MAG TPA: antirestriction protein ArdA [Candidatus Blautia excrementipullorum]|nr:antirestriction protein ArdA [Candidatus Blautia excrementipullorum]